MGANIFRQHLIDPVSCIRCGTCEYACQSKAISTVAGTLVVDHSLCGGSGDCLVDCPTGSIDNWRILSAGAAYTVEAQAAWRVLPDQAPFDADVAGQVLPALPAVGHGAPASAPTPTVNVADQKYPAIAQLVRNVRLSPADADTDVRHLVFSVAHPEFCVVEGQSVGVIPAGCDTEGREHLMRVYSVASARDGEKGISAHIAFTVKRVTTDRDGKPYRGICSNYLCDLKPGDRIRIAGPFGHSFLMPDDPECRLLMICTGTGIAPMRGFIERRRNLGQAKAQSLILFYGGRTVAELPYYSDLVGWAGSEIDLNLALSRADEQPRKYVQDALSEQREKVAALLADPKGYVYLCGLRGMEDGVMSAFDLICRASGLDWNVVQSEMKSNDRFHVETY